MSLEDIERRLRALEDVEEIKRLKARYCAYCDDNYDADKIASLFVADAIWDGGIRGKAEGREGIREFFVNAPNRLPFAVHMVMNPIIEVSGTPPPASGTCSSRAPTPTATGRYGDLHDMTKSTSEWTASGCSNT